MRHIGIAGMECFDGPCNPWAKSVCHNCPIRPMKIYQGNGNSLGDRELCNQNGYGVLVSPRGCTGQHHFPYYAIDNGAFGAWVNKKEWKPEPFLRLLDKALKLDRIADFAVCPDRVAAGVDSLNLSLGWLKDLPEGIRYYLAVQDGMSVEDVEPIIKRFAGLFVGGTMDWKLATSSNWIQLAHRHQKPCHIGRIGTWPRIRWAANIGADSIDSSSWPHNNSYHHIEYAQKQSSLEVKA